MTLLISGRPLGEAAAKTQDETSSFDIASNLAGMFEAGAFASMSCGDER